MSKYSKKLGSVTTGFIFPHCYCTSHTTFNFIRCISRRLMSKQGENKGQKRPEHLKLTSTQTRLPDIFDAEISYIEQLSPTIKGFTLQVISKEWSVPTFKAGQWVDFFIPGMEKVGGYSMCAEPERLTKQGKLDLAVKYSTWPPAHWLHTEAKLGSQISFRVGGDFHYPNKIIEAAEESSCGHDLLLVAGGVGINPLASIFFHIYEMEKEKKEKNQNNCRVNLLYSARKNEDLIFLNKIRDAVQSSKTNEMVKDSLFNATFFLTKEPGDDNGSLFKHKRIDLNELKESIELFSRKNCERLSKNRPLFCFLCGPPEMLKQITSMLINDLGIPKEHVFYERWW